MGEYYEILGVRKDSTEEDIKKAYRKQALRWHPDKNPDNRDSAEARFKEISEAYEVLSNKEKRDLYDRYGKEGLSSQNGGQQEDFGASGVHVHVFRSPDDIFREFFGGFDPFEDFFFASHFETPIDPEPPRRRRRYGNYHRGRSSNSNFFSETFDQEDCEPNIAFTEIDEDEEPFARHHHYHHHHHHSRPRRSRHRHYHNSPNAHNSFFDPFAVFRSQMLFNDPFVQMERHMQQMNNMMNQMFGRF